MSQNKVLCLVGICGAGMAPLAIYLAKRGFTVYGWDDFPDLKIKDLLTNNRIVFLPEKILPSKCDIVVISSAIRTDSDEICLEAKKNNIAICKRGEFLAEVLSDRKLIAIVGSHGKTSVSANLAEIVIHCNKHIDYIVGGFFKDDKYSPAAYFDDSEWAIAEIDESDCTMEAFVPHITVALNYDDDHVTNYNGSAGLKASFARFFQRTKHAIFFNHEDAVISGMVKKTEITKVSLPKFSEISFEEKNQKIALSTYNNIFHENITQDIKFYGIKRRNDLMCITDNIVFIHDYAHHPTEIKAILDHARKHYPEYNITVVFQPHRVSRTRQYFKEFAEILSNFDNVILVDIYRAFEEQCNEISSSLIFDKILNNNKLFIGDLSLLGENLNQYCKNLDNEHKHLILFVCAGNLVNYAKDFVDEWKISFILDELCDAKLTENISLKDQTSFGCNSVACVMLYPYDIEQLKKIISVCKKYNQKWFLIGNGSNIVFPNGMCHDFFIKLDGNFWNKCFQLNENTIRCFAGVKLFNLAKLAKHLGFNCCSFLSGIPATIGGAVKVNAGAYGFSMADIVKCVYITNDYGEILCLNNDDCQFKYRNSGINGVVSYVDIKLQNFDKLNEVDFFSVRSTTQPRGRTFGSVFKNPKEGYAGRLIEEVALKGYRCGDAMISNKHANFMLNLGDASSKDVEFLIDKIRYEVFSRIGIFLENEVLLFRK